MSKLLVAAIGFALCAASAACGATKSQSAGVTVEPISGTPSVVPTATMPAVLPTPFAIPTQNAYESARELYPCRKGTTVRRGAEDSYIYIDPKGTFEVDCAVYNGVYLGDITVAIAATGSISGYRNVLTNRVKPVVCDPRIIPSERVPYLLITGPDLDKSVTPLDQQKFSDGHITCG